MTETERNQLQRIEELEKELHRVMHPVHALVQALADKNTARQGDAYKAAVMRYNVAVEDLQAIVRG